MLHVDKASENYTRIAKLLHWSIALLIIFNYCLGLILKRTDAYTLHKQVGLTILVLVIIRILWRFTHPYPKMLDSLTPIEKFLARLAHITLYILMFAIPFAGILLVDAHGGRLNLWGIIPIPSLIAPKPHPTIHIIKRFHEYMADAIIILAALHILAALKHHFINKDTVLSRMLTKHGIKNNI